MKAALPLLLTATLAGGLWAVTQRGEAAAAQPPVPMPSVRPLPQGPSGALVRAGADLVAHMPERLKGRIGSKLTCTNCHLNGGTQAEAAPWVGVSRWYPVYRARSGKVDDLGDRVNDCVERSLNGKPLAKNSPEMGSILAYMDWLSQDVPPGREVVGRGFGLLPTRPGDAGRGKGLYAQKCAACHGPTGQGNATFPPLWGPHSYTIGAGMGRWRTAGAFIKANMPFGQGHSLSEADAVDIAAFVDRQPRPDFAGKKGDWPKGGKPADSPY
jgi:thiosulfate dehydrogenase